MSLLETVDAMLDEPKGERLTRERFDALEREVDRGDHFALAAAAYALGAQDFLERLRDEAKEMFANVDGMLAKHEELAAANRGLWEANLGLRKQLEQAGLAAPSAPEEDVPASLPSASTGDALAGRPAARAYRIPGRLRYLSEDTAGELLGLVAEHAPVALADAAERATKGASPATLPGWVTPEAAWPEGTDPELVARLDFERQASIAVAAVPAWLADPDAGLLAIELLSGASEAYECAGWSTYAVEMFVNAAKASLDGVRADVSGHGVTIDADWIAAIAKACVVAGGWPSDIQFYDGVAYYLFSPDAPAMVWETEAIRMERVIRKQMAEIERRVPPFGDDRKGDAARRAVRPWLRMLLTNHGEERAAARRIDRGEP